MVDRAHGADKVFKKLHIYSVIHQLIGFEVIKSKRG